LYQITNILLDLTIIIISSMSVNAISKSEDVHFNPKNNDQQTPIIVFYIVISNN